MLYNKPSDFRDEMLHGYAAAFPQYIVEVPGGVAKATELQKGKVVVINGGGSGHYPAFCGIIGQGFMDATVVGNIFTSPSTDDVYNVAKAVDNGTGIFIIGGNYTGDKINFDLAADKLKNEGIDARTFYITDDIASAPAEEWQKRRGNIGTFTVFKAAGAAAELGHSIDEVVRLTSHCNDCTRTMSVGMRGCTLPGYSKPMFEVPAGKMEVGQGIHGEAGVYENDLCSAAEIAKLLVDRVLAEKPTTAGNRLAVILNGLGSTKYEELFVVWNTVHQLLTDLGYQLIEPQVGEFVTSLDMEGIALSVTFLDDELEELWCYSADTPAFKKGVVNNHTEKKRIIRSFTTNYNVHEASDYSRKCAQYVFKAFERIRKMLIEQESYLAKIDSIVGDGDHGQGMLKGATFALEAIQQAVSHHAGLGSTLKKAGEAWAGNAGGTSGVLWGNALIAAGNYLGDDMELITLHDIIKAIQTAADKITSLGGAHLGDKTMLDVLYPFITCLQEAEKNKLSANEAWTKGSICAGQAAEDTRKLTPKVGRARPQAKRSLGTLDAGAVSLALCIKEVNS